jgi:hypothetical protein
VKLLKMQNCGAVEPVVVGVTSGSCYCPYIPVYGFHKKNGTSSEFHSRKKLWESLSIEHVANM